MTTTCPSYTNVRKVRLEVGGFLSEISDDTIQTSILEASLEADALTFVKSLVNTNLYLHARREYVTCLASSYLLDNLNNQTLKAKTLADLSVQYDTNGIRDALGKVQNCLDKWLPQLAAGGGAKEATQPRGVIKGACDPDRLKAGRLWQSEENGLISTPVYPGANTKARPAYKRRYVKGFKPPKGKLW
jgi:hypothetical protein